MTGIATGTYEFTAANGETLVATFTGRRPLCLPAFSPSYRGTARCIRVLSALPVWVPIGTEPLYPGGQPLEDSCMRQCYARILSVAAGLMMVVSCTPR